MEDRNQSDGTDRTQAHRRGLRLRFPIRLHLAPGGVTVGVELLVVLLWTLIVTRPYLNLDPTMAPEGREYLSAIQTHHLWTRAQACGWCAVWNGSEQGGAPAFVDPHGSMLHPLVIVTTLLWGVVNGSKVALIGAFFMAGLAQWWLARTLGLGRTARVWSACMAVAAGHLSGRMELGAFGVVLSTAACALVLPPLVAVSRTGSRRAAVLLGITLAQAALAGQGYMQIGLGLILPAAILLVPWERERFFLLARRYALAAGLALLLASPFLVPLLHFLPEFTKSTDPNFGSGQPLAYVPLNLVIDDYAFFTSDALHKLPFPHLYVNFIGWVPVLLALSGLRGGRGSDERRSVIFLASSSVLALWISTGEPLGWLVDVLPIPWLSEQIAGVRHPSQIAGLAVPPILALAAIGLDRLLSAKWLKLKIAASTGESTSRLVSIDLRWLLAVPLVAALITAEAFGGQWIGVRQVRPGVYDVLAAMRTPDLQWVNTPFGEHFFIEPAINMGLKLGAGVRTWRWKDRTLPEPVLEANRGNAAAGMTQVAVVDGVPIYSAPPGREYAAVTHVDGTRTVCTAHGIGGDIDVICDAPQAGRLTVLENKWSGWLALLDGDLIQLQPGQWLAVEMPAGRHTIQFRYRPWDVPLGIALSVMGAVLAVYQWRKKETPDLASPATDSPAGSGDDPITATRSDPARAEQPAGPRSDG
ncbi:MAG TPA: hypothetical protein VIK33_03450 [Anaerolineae bacterium]